MRGDEGIFDAIVVGAGAAGLTAARDLARRGRKVAILEARHRLGGRIWTERRRDWPRPIDLGAEFVHGGNRELWSLLGKRRSEARPIPERGWLARDGRLTDLSDAWVRTRAALLKIGPGCRTSYAAWRRRRGASLAELDRLLVDSIVEGYNGAVPERMSAATLYRSARARGEDYRLKAGYGTLGAALEDSVLSAGAIVQVGTAVTTIRWGRAQVEVATAQGASWRGRAAVVTVPLGVLRASRGERGSLSFDPPLRSKERLWRRLEPGHAVRLVMRLRADAWRKGPIPAPLRADRGRRLGFLRTGSRDFPVWWAQAPDPILVGWMGGPAARAMAGLRPSAILGRAIASLAGALGCAPKVLRRLILDWGMHDWTADPFARGAYSFSTAGLEDAPARLGAPVGRTLFFAGEATADPLELGTVHGAVASGRRAAGEVERALKRR